MQAERDFWEAYRETLRKLTIVDPACGSGAFLIAAFDFLAGEYRRINERLADLTAGKGTTGGQLGLFDPDREILTQNLFGVDVNAASVEITKLSLWIKTAKRGKALDSLEANVRVGNSLIEDSDYHHRAFVWAAAFPHVFSEGGFDVVLGNPPYVRMELIKPFKPYLERRFAVVSDRADLYAYFFEQGVRLLKPGVGRLGYISSASFFRSGSGRPLRSFLSDNTALEKVIDFGDLQIFGGVTTYPAIVCLRRLDGVGADAGTLAFAEVKDRLPADLSTTFRARAQTLPAASFGASIWSFSSAGPSDIRAKLASGRKSLAEVYGAPLYGIKTGFNRALVVDRRTRDKLVEDDAGAAEILKPFLKGESLKRWSVRPDGLFLVNTPRGKVDIDAYPSVRQHLEAFRPELEARATKQAWFELQQGQLAYQSSMVLPKVVWPHFQSRASFALDESGYFLNNKAFFFPKLPLYELAFLNSSLAWFLLSSSARIKRGGFIEAEAQYVGQLPSLSDVPAQEGAALSELAAKATASDIRRSQAVAKIRHRINDLRKISTTGSTKLSLRLSNWWELDFGSFRKEVKRVFGTDMPVAERDEWEDYLTRGASNVRMASAEVERAQAGIENILSELFELSKADVETIAISAARPASSSV